MTIRNSSEKMILFLLHDTDKILDNNLLIRSVIRYPRAIKFTLQTFRWFEFIISMNKVLHYRIMSYSIMEHSTKFVNRLRLNSGTTNVKSMSIINEEIFSSRGSYWHSKHARQYRYCDNKHENVLRYSQARKILLVTNKTGNYRM